MPTTSLRFHIFPIPASERPRDRFTFWVTGKGAFPIDMLRYDAAWPADGDAAAGIADSLADYTTRSNRGHRYSIRLRSHQEPALGRWSSFGWSVSADKMEF